MVSVCPIGALQCGASEGLSVSRGGELTMPLDRMACWRAAERCVPQSGRLCHRPEKIMSRSSRLLVSYSREKRSAVSCFVLKGIQMAQRADQTASEPLHVSLVAIPEAVVSTLSGIFDVMNVFAMMPAPAEARFQKRPFCVEIVGLQPGPVELASGIPVSVHRAVADVDATDIIIVPSILLPPEGWR